MTRQSSLIASTRSPKPPSVSSTSLGIACVAAIRARAFVDGTRSCCWPDEPTSHQDAGHISTILRLLRTMVDRGTCIVVASHDHAVADGADRILDLDR